MGTSHPFAAQVLLHGAKLWVALPPGVDRRHLRLGGDDGGDDDEAFDLAASDWFLRCDDLPPGAVVILQRPREVVVVPAGWWHVVLNVADSVALSRSLALARDFAFAFLARGPRTDLERDRQDALARARAGGACQ